MDSVLPRVAVAAPLISLLMSALAQAETLPKDGRFNLRCSISVRTVSGLPVPSHVTANYAVDLDSQTWCAVEDGCAQRYSLRKVGASAIKFTTKNAFSEHESFLVNLESGKLAGSSDSAPNGLSNGFQTYLADGDCISLPYAERHRP